MTINNRNLRALFLAAALCLASEWLSGCLNKSRHTPTTETASETSGSGTLTDARDGKTYKTAKMPDGKVWMAENLNYHTSDGEFWCYPDFDNDDFGCDKYGALYDWYTAIAVCPAGWHLPSRQEWEDLATDAGGHGAAGRKLKSKTGWGNDKDSGLIPGTDDYGFSALSGGTKGCCAGSYINAGYGGYWWTATERNDYDDMEAWFMKISYATDHVSGGYFEKGFGYSVRCVMDNR